MTDDPRATPPARAVPGTTLAMLAHHGGVLTYVFLGWVTALVVWLVVRDQDAATAREARSALNFQLTALLAMVVLQVVEAFPVIGIVGALGKIAVGIAALVLSLLAAAAAYRGSSYRYPFTLELVR